MTDKLIKDLEQHLNTFSGTELVQIYNSTVPSGKATKRFATKKAGIEHCTAAILAYNDKSKLGFGIAEIFAAHSKTTAKSHTGKLSKWATSIIKSTVKSNPRKDGTWGQRSFNIILAAGSAGITYEDYIKSGGRRQDLAWDFEHGYVSIGEEKKDLMYKSRDSHLL